MVTDFRGFKHFGVIGGYAMLLCWLATYTVLPGVCCCYERVAPLPAGAGLAKSAARRRYGVPSPS